MRATAVHEPPVYYDLAGSLERAADILARAASEGSELVVFPEAWLPGYLDFVWTLTPSQEADSDFAHVYSRLWANAVDLSTDALAPLRDAARDAGVVVVMGLQEKAGGTLYNAAVVIDADGRLAHVHRKLMPTNAERQVWGFGDGSTLRAVDTAIGRIGVLLCWENYMPLARTALYADGAEVHCAPTADPREMWHITMQHIAKEGGCAVIGVNTCLKASDVPEDFPARVAVIADEEWMAEGNASIVEPGGRVLTGPHKCEQGLFHADIDMARVAEARRTFDVVGHYSRPDVFTLEVNRRRNTPVHFT